MRLLTTSESIDPSVTQKSFVCIEPLKVRLRTFEGSIYRGKGLHLDLFVVAESVMI